MNKKALRKKWRGDCLPTVFALLMSGLYSVMDGLFIGRAVGDAGLAAVNIAWPVPAVITAAGIGIGIGGSILYSNAAGRGEQEESEYRYHLAIVLLGVTGAVLTAILLLAYPELMRLLGAKGNVYEQACSYSRIIAGGCLLQVMGAGMVPLLRNRGRALGAMISMSVGMLVNLGLNYLLIFHVGIGIRGAAIGTVSAQAVVILLCVYMLYGRGKEKLRIVWDMGRVWENIRAGASAFGLSLAPTVVLVFTNYRCLRLGGDAAVACYAVISYVTFPVQYILTGIGDGSQPLLSYFHGSGQKEELRYIRQTASRFAFLTGAFLMILVWGVTPQIPSVFGMSGLSAEYFDAGMRISSAAFLMLGLNRFHTAYLSATLRMKQASSLIYGETLTIAPFLLLVLPEQLGIPGIWMTLPLTQLLILVCYGVSGKVREHVIS